MSANKQNQKKSYLYFSSFSVIFSLWKILSSKRKVQFVLLLFLMTFSGILELNIIRLLVPLLNSFLNNSFVNNNLIVLGNVQNLIQRFTKLDVNTLNILIYSTLVLISTILRLLTLWINERLTAAIGVDISYEAFSISLRLPYELHISKNSSELIAATIKYCDDTAGYLKSLLKAIYFSLITISISLGLFIINSSNIP